MDPPTQYGAMPRQKFNRPETVYLKQTDTSEIIEFRNELTYWSNRVEEIKTHYGATLHPSQVQELLELQTKINLVKESIVPGRKCLSRTNSNMTSPMLSPIISPNLTPYSSQPTSPRHSQPTSPGHSPRNTMMFHQAITKPLPIPPGSKPAPPPGTPPSHPGSYSQELTSSEPSPLPSPRRGTPRRHPSDQSIYRDRVRDEDVILPSRRRSNRSRSSRNSWNKEKGEESQEYKPSSAPKSFYHREQRRRPSKSSRTLSKPEEPTDPADLQLGLALIKAVKYLDTN